ncbi:hypothetical protein SSBR45G_02520 [Bradyrhizobium sp. SSBR45G]|uniref:hypothetical protein n=1 Tax=unclassified Bradyrhizobium TaxID=2631580 RepID=UPI002342BCE5|nr:MULTISPECIES: hypothetical protein [unclassified Bradyrhizobium]GLH75344.1 hypothetical protein SSBR45G_02520 [Bradyrhizobium sp. SSBR45G]GLH82869.1 hypothetical protein SSBR45R_03290 [Bradyrhizobium sp. SSBR45R]
MGIVGEAAWQSFPHDHRRHARALMDAEGEPSWLARLKKIRMLPQRQNPGASEVVRVNPGKEHPPALTSAQSGSRVFAVNQINRLGLRGVIGNVVQRVFATSRGQM